MCVWEVYTAQHAHEVSVSRCEDQRGVNVGGIHRPAQHVHESVDMCEYWGGGRECAIVGYADCPTRTPACNTEHTSALNPCPHHH